MVSFRDFVLGQPLEKKDEQQPEELKEEKPVEEKSEPKWAPGKNFHPKEFIKFIGVDDTVNKRMFTSGEFGSYREQLTKKLEEIAARKKDDQFFTKEEAARIARELCSKSDNVSRLLGKAINNALNQ